MRHDVSLGDIVVIQGLGKQVRPYLDPGWSDQYKGLIGEIVSIGMALVTLKTTDDRIIAAEYVEIIYAN